MQALACPPFWGETAGAPMGPFGQPLAGGMASPTHGMAAGVPALPTRLSIGNAAGNMPIMGVEPPGSTGSPRHVGALGVHAGNNGAWGIAPDVRRTSSAGGSPRPAGSMAWCMPGSASAPAGGPWPPSAAVAAAATAAAIGRLPFGSNAPVVNHTPRHADGMADRLAVSEEFREAMGGTAHSLARRRPMA